jgi:hypothetical protein
LYRDLSLITSDHLAVLKAIAIPSPLQISLAFNLLAKASVVTKFKACVANLPKPGG